MQAEEPVYVVRLTGMVRDEYKDAFRDKMQGQLPGNVVVVDSGVEDIVQLSPRDAGALVKLLVRDWDESRLGELLEGCSEHADARDEIGDELCAKTTCR